MKQTKDRSQIRNRAVFGPMKNLEAIQTIEIITNN